MKVILVKHFENDDQFSLSELLIFVLSKTLSANWLNVNVCNASLCRTKKFGVGTEEDAMPLLNNLMKYNSNPPQYFLNVGEGEEEKRIELKTEHLANPVMFSIAILEKADLVIPKLKDKDWREYYLKPLIDKMETIEPLESLDPLNQIISLLQDWTTNRQNARTMDDILNKLLC